MHLVKKFSEQLASYLSASESTNGYRLVKFHESSIDVDFSFPLSLKIWKNYLTKLDSDEIDKCEDSILMYSADDKEKDASQAIERLIAMSANWVLNIASVEIKDHKCELKIRRAGTFSTFLNKLTPSYGRNKKLEEETIAIELDKIDNDLSITQHRVELVKNTVSNLLAYSQFIPVSDPAIAKHKLLVTSRSNLGKCDDRNNCKLLICGAVVDPIDKKVSQKSASEFIKQRQDDMRLISIHKYGLRVKDDEAFTKLIESSGKAATTLDLLEVKQSSAVTVVSADPKQSFILYNSARMETLMEKFETRVAEGYYKDIPAIDKIDTGLLKEDEEWLLMKVMLMFPDVIDKTISEVSQGRVSLHLIHKYISSIVNTFSIYYRRSRLLVENRPQLMPTLHAKIHFLRALRRIFNECLFIYGIQPVAFM